MILQNLTGVGVASLLGLNPLIGLLAGSVFALLAARHSHCAWARFAPAMGVSNA